nr:GDSL-type esterase/lipase family protein [uncultured Macellibacteroides sp.]
MRNILMLSILFMLLFNCCDKVTDPGNQNSDPLILFTGSSTIAMWKNLNSYFVNFNINNSGISGSTTETMIKEKEKMIFSYNPSFIVMYAGENDLLSISLDELKSNMDYLVEEIQSRLPNTQLLILSLKPSPYRRSKHPEFIKANYFYKEYASKYSNIHFVDIWNPMINQDNSINGIYFMKDSLHLSDQGYDLISELTLNKILSIQQTQEN